MVEPKDTGSDDEAGDESFIDKPVVLDKYKASADVTNAALKYALTLCVPGADIHTVCMTVDKFIDEELKKVFSSKKSKKLERGIAFPCCISVNSQLGCFSPLKDETAALKENDVAKIALGSHLDGFVTQAGHTIVVNADPKKKVEDPKVSNAIVAAYKASLAAQRTIKEQGTNQSVTEIIKKVAESFGCQPVEAVLSHKQKKWLIDGNDVIINRDMPEQKVEKF
jgi:methionine aminopeptidase